MILINLIKRFTFLVIVTASFFVITSCKKDSPDPSPTPPDQKKIAYSLSNNVAISNEGAFGSGNATLSIYYPLGDSIVNDVFNKVNNRPLGDVFQSIGFAGDRAYLVINASNKIEVVYKDSCIQIATISDLSGPRYFASINSTKAYISLWGNGGKVGVLDLTSNSLTKQIAVGNGPEKLIIVGSKAYIANSGGWGTDNRVSVINTQTDELETTITVGDNPKDFVIDKYGMIWVLCAGNVVYDNSYNIVSQTSSKLMMINPSTNTIDKTILLGEAYHPSQLEINPDKELLYYGGDFGIAGIFSILITATEKPSVPLINDYFYGFNVDPVSGIIYGLQAPSFTSAGMLKRYSATGQILGTLEVGVGPNGAYFAS
jgi:YVTN family beta-propeller protein